MSDTRERLEGFAEWSRRMMVAYALMPEEERAALHEWERTHVDGRLVLTSDWPGWERIIGHRSPDWGKEARKEFRDERLRRIAANHTPVQLDHAPRIIAHIMPQREYEIDLLENVSKETLALKLVPMISKHSVEYTPEPNADGFIAYAPGGEPCYAYTQLFNDGKIEIVRASYYVEHRRYIHSEYEDEILRAIQRGLTLQEMLGIRTPVFLTLSVLGAAGCRIGTDDLNAFPSSRPIRQEDDEMRMQEVIVTSFGPHTIAHLAMLMKTSFYRVWRASGLPKSFNYDNEGNWLRGE
jgi:hypothetical protein